MKVPGAHNGQSLSRKKITKDNIGDVVDGELRALAKADQVQDASRIVARLCDLQEGEAQRELCMQYHPPPILARSSSPHTPDLRAFHRAGLSKPLDTRKQQLLALRRFFTENETAIIEVRPGIVSES